MLSGFQFGNNQSINNCKITWKHQKNATRLRSWRSIESAFSQCKIDLLAALKLFSKVFNWLIIWIWANKKVWYCARVDFRFDIEGRKVLFRLSYVCGFSVSICTNRAIMVEIWLGPNLSGTQCLRRRPKPNRANFKCSNSQLLTVVSMKFFARVRKLRQNWPHSLSERRGWPTLFRPWPASSPSLEL